MACITQDRFMCHECHRIWEANKLINCFNCNKHNYTHSYPDDSLSKFLNNINFPETINIDNCNTAKCTYRVY